MLNTTQQVYSVPFWATETVQNGHKCIGKKKRGTKQCGDCFVHAQNNKQLNCFNCTKNGKVVSNWLKAKKKQSGIKIGKVCPRIGCNWSTKGNRTLFCGRCNAPFPAANKRKSYKGKATADQKATKKRQKKTSNKTALIIEPRKDLTMLSEESEESEMMNEKFLDSLLEDVSAEDMDFGFDFDQDFSVPLSLDIFSLELLENNLQ